MNSALQRLATWLADEQERCTVAKRRYVADENRPMEDHMTIRKQALDDCLVALHNASAD